MAASMQIQLDEQVTQQIRELSVELHQTDEEVAEQVVKNGVHALRRQAFYERNVGSANVERAIEILRSAGGNNPPMPGDELPDDLKYLLDR
jgi:hypothetical protein